MAIFYDSGNAKNSDFNPSFLKRLNPNSQWANHSYNHFVLQHIAKTTKDFRERTEARNELEIAERKMKFWERQPGFSEADGLYWRKEIFKY
jgi:hypothetical protein